MAYYGAAPHPSIGGQNRNKTPARIYFFVFSLLYAVLLLDNVISLGCFGVKQAHVDSKTTEWTGKCILFGTFAGTHDGKNKVHLGSKGTCAFVLWGQASLSIVAFVWLGYSIIAAILGSKV